MIVSRITNTETTWLANKIDIRIYSWLYVYLIIYIVGWLVKTSNEMTGYDKGFYIRQISQQQLMRTYNKGLGSCLPASIVRVLSSKGAMISKAVAL